MDADVDGAYCNTHADIFNALLQTWAGTCYHTTLLPQNWKQKCLKCSHAVMKELKQYSCGNQGAIRIIRSMPVKDLVRWMEQCRETPWNWSTVLKQVMMDDKESRWNCACIHDSDGVIKVEPGQRIYESGKKMPKYVPESWYLGEQISGHDKCLTKFQAVDLKETWKPPTTSCDEHYRKPCQPSGCSGMDSR